MQPVKIATWSDVPDRTPVGALVDGVDLVVVRFDDNHSVLYGRCLHRGALMADGHIDGDNIASLRTARAVGRSEIYRTTFVPLAECGETP